MRSWSLGLLLLVACGGKYATSPDRGPASDAGTDAAIMRACSASATPEVVAEIDGRAEELALVAAGGFVHYGVEKLPSEPTVPYTGELGRVREHDGAREVFATGYAGGVLASDGTDLFYFDGIVEPAQAQTWWTKPTAVIARPLAGGEGRVVGTPGPHYGQGLRSWGGRGVVFSDEIVNGSSATAGVARWDGSLTTQLVTSGDVYHYLGWYADADGVYWMQREGNDYGLVTAPLSGGAATTLMPSVYGWVIASDAQTVFLSSHVLLPNMEIVAVAKKGGASKVLTPRGYFGSAAVADAGWLYYVDYKEQGHRLWRVRASGGTPELFAEDADPTMIVRSLAASPCGIYWMAGSSAKSRLMRKAR